MYQPLPAIMKKITYIILLFFPFTLLGQDYPRIDTVNYGKAISHVNHYLRYDDKDEKLIESYWFNNLGKHYRTYYGYEDYSQGMTVFEHNIKNEISCVKYLSYTSPHNDSISKMYYEESYELYKNGKRDNNTYNELQRKYSSMYEVINPENIKWNSKDRLPRIIIYKNQLDQDSLMEIFNDFGDGERYLDERVYFLYNRANELIRKIWSDVKNPNVFEFQAFKQNTTELDDSITILTGTNEEKIYKYFKDSIVIKYYVNGQYTGYEINKSSNNGLKLEELVFNTKNDTLSYFIKNYNSEKLLTSENRVKHNGYNGFGYSMDLERGDIKKYKYDSKNRLIRIDGYEGNKHISVDRFEFLEK